MENTSLSNATPTMSNLDRVSNQPPLDKEESQVGEFNIPLTVLSHSINMLGACGGNILVIFTILRFKALRTGTNVLIAALAVSDLLVGLGNVFRISQLIWHDIDTILPLCFARLFLIQYGPLASIICIFAISCDRYIAVIYPLLYQSLVTTSRSCVVAGTIVVYSSVVVLIMILDTGYEDGMPCEYYFIFTPAAIAVVTLHLTLCVVGTVILNGHIIAVAVRKRNSIAPSQVSPPGGSSDQSNQLRKSISTIKVFSLVGGIYFVTFYLPFTIVANYAATEPWAIYRSAFFRRMQVALGAGIVVNSAVNPIIYALGYAPLKRAFKQLFCCKPQDVD